MGLEKDILKTLRRGPRTYEGLQTVFPYKNLVQTLITMEEMNLVQNREGAWFITTRGRGKISHRGYVLASLLVIPTLAFVLLSAQYHSVYTEALNQNETLLHQKQDIDSQLSQLKEQTSQAETRYQSILDKLTEEEEKTSQLKESHNASQQSLDSAQEELSYFQCLEQCTPNRFVTVDNAYVKAKVDEITSGLTTLKQRQVAVFNFVRDDIEDDESIFRFGRTDLWEYPEDILRRGKGHYEDKYLLLLTMLRIAGTPSQEVRFIAAEVDGNDGWIWVEVYDGTTWWILDPFEGYTFTTTPRDEFNHEHTVKILWWFNDIEYRRG
ncbi:MAG: transglutaminase domain-containing protein [Candidatus Methanofastidiosia archaeon]